MSNEDYYKIKEKIADALEFYQERKISDTKYSVKLSNGDSINIKYRPKNIAHLLGINTSYLRATGLYKGSSFKILYKIVQNFERFMNYIERGYIDDSEVFSEYIYEKLKNFKRICGINLFDIEFIVEYRKSRNKTQKEPLYDGYYIGYTNGYSLSVIGFTRDDDNNTYYPSTSRLMKANTKESEDFLKRLFENQIVTTIEIMYKKIMNDDFSANSNAISKSYYYHHKEKLNKINTCKEYAETYGGIPNTIISSIYYIDKVININIDNRINISMYEEIADLISKRKMIDFLDLKDRYEYIDDAILDIISSYNDSLVSNNDESLYSYKNIITELENLKQELEKRRSLLEKVEDENNKLKAKNKLLELENMSLKENYEEVVKKLTRNKK